MVAFAQRRLYAMGSDAHLIACGGSRADLRRVLDRAAARVFELERLWSRFLAGSDVSALNRSPGRPVRVGAETVALVAEAVDAFWRTGGRFDPTVLGDVVRAGYDRDLASIGVPGTEPSPGGDTAAGYGSGCAGIVVEALAGTVTLPLRTGFDPGGLAKGLAADWVSAQMMSDGALGACANVGGDLCVIGESPQGEGWRIGIEPPGLSGHVASPEPIAVLDLAAGGVATSTVARRRWKTGSADDQRVPSIVGSPRTPTEAHHVIDPRTGAPSRSDAIAVTVAAGRAVWAETLATAALVAGVRTGCALVREAGAVGVVVGQDGRQHRIGLPPVTAVRS
ncbi:MAG: FAD:protein FMN transferase [Acidimicrobiales bacterium]